MKFLPFFLTLLLFIAPVHANSIAEFGLMIAGNTTMLDGNYQDTENIDKVSNKSFGMGAILILNANKNFSLQFEPSFIEKGGNNGRPAEQYRAIRINFLEFPLLAKFNYKQVYLLCGGYQAIRLSAKRYHNLDDKYSIKNNLQETDNGVIVGAGINLPLQDKHRFVFELQYHKGLKNLIAYENANGDELKLSMLSFKIGIIF